MANKRKLLSNSFSILINRVVQSITAFVLSASISRLLGVDELGKYLLAFSFYFVFVGISSYGLKTLMIREIARREDNMDISFYLMNCSYLQLAFSLMGYGVLATIVTVLPYDFDVSLICYIVGAAVIPFSLSNMTEAVFQAEERMHLIAVSTVPVYIIRLLLMIFIMQQGYGINAIGSIFVASELFILIIQWLLLIRNASLKFKWQPDFTFLFRVLKSSSSFMLIDGVGMVSTRLELFIISLIGNEFLIGLYGGVGQLLQPFILIVDSIISAAYPSLTKAAEAGIKQQQQITHSVIETLLSVAVPTCIGIFFFGGDLLEFVYGNARFREATTVLLISSFVLIILSFSRPLSFVLIANGLEKFNIREVSINATLKFIVGLFLVPRYQLIGAAILNIIVGLSSYCQFSYAVYNRLFTINSLTVFRYPLIISILITPIFIGLQILNLNFLVTLTVSTIAYLVAVCLVVLFELHRSKKTLMGLFNK